MIKVLSIFLLICSSISFSQMRSNSVNSNIDNFNLINNNSIKTDWNILTSPFLFYQTSEGFYSLPNNHSPYSLYTSSQLNSRNLNFTTPNEMLTQFQFAQNWETQKKYGVFAKYLGIAQFMGAVGLAAVHISKFHTPPKGNIKSKVPKFKK